VRGLADGCQGDVSKKAKHLFATLHDIHEDFKRDPYAASTAGMLTRSIDSPPPKPPYAQAATSQYLFSSFREWDADLISRMTYKNGDIFLGSHRSSNVPDDQALPTSSPNVSSHRPYTSHNIESSSFLESYERSPGGPLDNGQNKLSGSPSLSANALPRKRFYGESPKDDYSQNHARHLTSPDDLPGTLLTLPDMIGLYEEPQEDWRDDRENLLPYADRCNLCEKDISPFELPWEHSCSTTKQIDSVSRDSLTLNSEEADSLLPGFQPVEPLLEEEFPFFSMKAQKTEHQRNTEVDHEDFGFRHLDDLVAETFDMLKDSATQPHVAANDHTGDIDTVSKL
jgi:hypothetical protein